MQNLGLNIDSFKVKKQSYQGNISQILQSFWLRSFHCEKYPKIGVFSDQYFPAYEQNRIIRENGGQRKPLFWYIFYAVFTKTDGLQRFTIHHPTIFKISQFPQSLLPIKFWKILQIFPVNSFLIIIRQCPRQNYHKLLRSTTSLLVIMEQKKVSFL